MEKEQTTIRLPIELKEALRREAQENKLDISSLIRMILIEFVELCENEPKTAYQCLVE